MSHPRHIGIIMDGNGRWAQMRHRPRTFGHIKGARVAKKIITAACEARLENLTLYAFSTENWLRPQEEVTFLMGLLGRYLKKEVQSLVDQNIRFTIVGELHRLPPALINICQQTIDATAHCNGMNLIFAISYGSRSEITEVTKRIAQKVQDGLMSLSDITEETLATHLQTYPTPDVDLVIRTSGEKRLSNFLLWQAAYSELYFSSTLWPDFTVEEFYEIIENFNMRERRFGAVKTSTEQHP